MKNLRMLVPLLILAALANAQNMRSWVSGVGSDANPCIRTAPCRTFAGALPKTAPGGEINCVDAGDYGNGTQLNITQAVTIDCRGTLGTINAATVTVIFISAGASDVVTFRNLSISGRATGGAAIVTSVAGAVHLENIRISVQGTCVDFDTQVPSLLTIDNATISDCLKGIFAGSSGIVVVDINNTRITNSTFWALQPDNGSRVTIRNSTLYSNFDGVFQSPIRGMTLGSTATIVNCTLGYSGNAAIENTVNNQFILAFGNTFVNDPLVYHGSNIFTGADNNNSGSTPGVASGTVPKI